jgi:UDP-N-acetylmuramate: L-alanyl-gamma-D-glutamyl-meso-diaminopimelate ligase
MAKAEHVHLIGIGGTGMSALAGLLASAGCRVTGSDRELYPPTSTILARLGLEIRQGFDPAHLVPAPDLVVVGNAISRGNPELEEVLDRDLPYTSMPRLVAERFLRGRDVLVVAGTHGKTTTASMLATVLDHAGLAPGFLIGGQPLNFELPFREGRGRSFVIEGDEYDSAFFDKGPKFMHYRPRVVLLGPVEYDHADIYPDLEAVKTAFRRLVNLIPRRGLLVRHEDWPVTREVSARALSRVTGCGLEQGSWRAVELAHDGERTSFTIERDGRALARVELPTGGAHNVANALGVAVAAAEQGLDAQAIARGLAAFRGVRRRQEVRGRAGGVTVLDDFAHHPTAIAATLAAVRDRDPRARIWAVLEPRSWSLRRNVFQDRLAEAFSAADRVVIAEVWGAEAIPAGERLDPTALVRALHRPERPARMLADAAAIAEHLAAETRPGDVVVVMSNGGFGGLHERLLELLAAREGAALGG